MSADILFIETVKATTETAPVAFTANLLNPVTCSDLALEARGLVRLAQSLQRALGRAVTTRMALLQLDRRAHAEQRVHPGQQLRAMGRRRRPMDEEGEHVGEEVGGVAHEGLAVGLAGHLL